MLCFIVAMLLVVIRTMLSIYRCPLQLLHWPANIKLRLTPESTKRECESAKKTWFITKMQVRRPLQRSYLTTCAEVALTETSQRDIGKICRPPPPKKKKKKCAYNSWYVFHIQVLYISLYSIDIIWLRDVASWRSVGIGFCETTVLLHYQGPFY